MALGPARPVTSRGRTGLHGELGHSLFQLAPGRLHRAWDVSLSGTLDYLPYASRSVFGVALAAGPIARAWRNESRGAADSDDTTRLATQLVGRWTGDERVVAARVVLEYATFTNGSGSNDTGLHVAFGEASAGGYFEVGRSWRDDDSDHWVVSAGLMLRLPATLGLACCWRGQ